MGESGMIKVGKFNTLRVDRHVDFGVYLSNAEGTEEVLLPTRFVPEPCDIGSNLEVFVYLDSDDRRIATTETPLAQVGEFAVLKVVEINSVGAFLDWGLSKDLFLPHSEQTRPFSVGQWLIVFIYLDNTERIAASMRLERNMDKDLSGYEPDQPVDLIIAGRTDLGYKAIINGRHMGLLYENEVFQQLRYGQGVRGYIRQVRDDGRIDLLLQRTGHQAGDDIAPLILEQLEENDGFLPVHAGTSAEIIHEMFGLSKKKYKIALGGLYKQRLITIHDDGIRLTEPT
jgi:predicted RNA-binding protein (virulence factor B family)